MRHGQFIAHDVRRKVEGWQLTIAQHMPRWLRYWCVIVSAAKAAGNHKAPPDVTAIEMLKAEEEPPQRPVWGAVRASHLLRSVRR
jgi:hypothetical protein